MSFAETPTLLLFDTDLFLATPDVAAAADMLADRVSACAPTIALVPPVGRAAHDAMGAARKLSASPSPTALARLIGAQADQAAALLSIALSERAAPHRSLTAAQAGLIAEGDPLRASPVAVGGGALTPGSPAPGLTIAPAGVALSQYGEPLLIHPDQQAVFLAARLGARAVFLRDADRRSPTAIDSGASRLAASLGVRISIKTLVWRELRPEIAMAAA